MNVKTIAGLLIVAVVVSSGCTQNRHNIPTAADGYGNGANGGGYQDYNGAGNGGVGNPNGGGNANGGNGGNGYGGNGQGGLAGNGQGGNGQGGYGSNGGNGQGGNGAYANGGGSGQYTPADLRNPSSVLAQRIIYFEYDQSRIRPEFQTILNAHAALLADYPNLRIRLEGHADERGSREYNVALSERRGYSVLDYLAVKGVNTRQAEVVGYGEEVPAEFGQSESAWNRNRRVEIIYVGE